MNNNFNKTPVFLIDLSRDEDYELYLKASDESKENHEMVEKLDGSFIMEQLWYNKSRHRYLCITMFNHKMFWSGDSELRPLGKFTPNYIPYSGRAITFQHYLDIQTVLKKRDDAVLPKNNGYCVRMNDEVRRTLANERFEGWHRPYFAMKGSTHSIYTIYPYEQTYLDAAKSDEEAISAEEFVSMYKACYEPSEPMDFLDYKAYLGKAESDGKISEPKLDDAVSELYYRVIEEKPFGVIRIPDGTVRVLPKTFKKCFYITDVIFPEGLKAIEKYAFCECVNIRRVYIPKSINQIHCGAFHNCSSLVEIYYAGSQKEWKALLGNNISDKSKYEENGIAKLNNSELLRATVHYDCRL